MCSECGKIFSTSGGVQSHLRNVHSNSSNNTKAASILCSRCGLDNNKCGCEKTSFIDPDVVSCPLCGKQLLPRNLASHLHYHRQSSLRPYICRECSKTFTHAASLKRHALIHTGVKQFNCSQCNKGFYQKTAFQTHCKSHSSERISCIKCGKHFLTQYLLNFHVKSSSLCRNS